MMQEVHTFTAEIKTMHRNQTWVRSPRLLSRSEAKALTGHEAEAEA